MIELAILGLLKDHPMHGYQLNRELSEQVGGMWRVSYGSLYPSLRRLEREFGVGAGCKRNGLSAKARQHCGIAILKCYRVVERVHTVVAWSEAGKRNAASGRGPQRLRDNVFS